MMKRLKMDCPLLDLENVKHLMEKKQNRYDNQVMKSETKYIIKVCIGIMDNTIISIDKTFLGNKNIYNDFVYLLSSNLKIY